MVVGWQTGDSSAQQRHEGTGTRNESEGSVDPESAATVATSPRMSDARFHSLSGMSCPFGKKIVSASHGADLG